MRSPGRPPVARREHRQRFWAAIAAGVWSDRAGAVAGVSPAIGVRWFREGEGMPSVSRASLSGRHLSFAYWHVSTPRWEGLMRSDPEGIRQFFTCFTILGLVAIVGGIYGISDHRTVAGMAGIIVGVVVVVAAERLGRRLSSAARRNAE